MSTGLPSVPSDERQHGSASLLAVECVRALMERHGLPKYRQSAWLADAMGLSYSQAHRRMTGASAWSLEDLERVAGLFGESLADVVDRSRAEGAVRGTLRVGQAVLDCRLWLGEELERPGDDPVVAIRTSAGWSAVHASEATDETAYRIERLETRPGTAARKVIAVLDDDEDLTNTICAHLVEGGYEARPFYRTADLASSTKAQRYDAFVIDWIVGETSVVKLVAALRSQDAVCPIVVLTAQVLAGVVDEADIAEAVGKFDLMFHEKPVRMSILAATLARAFAALSPAAASA